MNALVPMQTVEATELLMVEGGDSFVDSLLKVLTEPTGAPCRIPPDPIFKGKLPF
jgi:hypothetical protein